MNPRDVLTISMATYREPQLWFTLEALHTYHPRVSYLVVNNAPEEDVLGRNTCLAIGGRWFHRPDLHGTSAPRDATFRLCETLWNCCIDAHVALEPGAVQCLLDYAEENPQSKDIFTGPYVGDDGAQLFTHWRPEESARPGYWGVWDTAWVTPRENGRGSRLSAWKLRTGGNRRASVITGTARSR